MPKKKTNQEFINEVFSLVGNEFTPLEDYKGSNIKIKFYHHKCENEILVRPKEFIHNGVRCSNCANNKKLSILDMKIFIENNSDCKLVSKTIKNSKSKINIKCKCENIFETTFSDFKHENKKQCNDCGNVLKGQLTKHTYEYVKNYIEKIGYSLLSTSYVNNSEKLQLKCNSGHEYSQSFSDYVSGHRCKTCAYENLGRISKKDIKEVKNTFEKEGYKLISNYYNNSKEKLVLECPKNHKIEMTFDDFHNGGNRCIHCYLISIRENATSHIFAHLRTYIDEWKKKSMKKCEYKCVLTNVKFDVVHHLYSFNLIAKETFQNLNIPIYESISKYSQDEIDMLISECNRLHDFYGEGVCLRNDVHKLYHSLYGFNNSSEQFNEFKMRYESGEFKELLIA
jgi:uncharacterized protein YkuJ